MKLKAIITESFPYVEKALDELPKFSSFDMPLLSQGTPVRLVLRPYYTVPGPAFEGPAKPGTSENGLPLNANFTGTNDDMTFVNDHPSTKDGPCETASGQAVWRKQRSCASGYAAWRGRTGQGWG
eukprot:8161150-Pyramimonas_sp.AAC.1